MLVSKSHSSWNVSESPVNFSGRVLENVVYMRPDSVHSDFGAI